MIDRIHIVITGPKGAGKTTFIERILSSNRSRSIDAVRWRVDSGVAEAIEVPGGDEDTERFDLAGSDLTGLIVYPGGELSEAADVLYESDVMLSVQDGILHEFDESVDIYQDMTVLIVRPDGAFEAALGQLLTHGLGFANLVLFNVDSAEGRNLAEKLQAGIELLRTEEPDQWRRIRAMCAGGVRITTRIIDFSDPRDAEMKRAVQSVKRKLPTESFISNEELDEFLDEDLPEFAEGVLRVKVTLENIEPPIWRRLLLPQDCTFWDLHVAIQDSMGWDDSHLHLFKLPGDKGSEPILIGLPDPDGGMEIIPGWTQEVFQHVPPGSGTRYTYDFGDSWEHWVQVEDVEPPAPGRSYPACIDGARQCPPEDCGGPFSYPQFLAAITDPEHEKHADIMEWWGETFDPEEFDLELVRFSDARARLKWATRQ